MNILLVEFNPFQPVQTPIALGYLAATAKREGHRVDVLALGSDACMSPQEISERAVRLRPDVVGFSTYQRTIFLVHAWAQFLKRLLPGCVTVIGGPQAVFLPTEALAELPFFDMICRAEGERALLELLRCKPGVAGRGQPVPGWSGRDGEALWDGARLEDAPDLDAYPSPYLDGTLDLADMDEAILLASRGCPYRCAFCYTPAAFGRKIRVHSVERVLEEMTWIARSGVRRFWFADPSFTFHAGRVHALLDGILARGVHAEMWLETRADLVDAHLLDKMKRAGVHTVAYGLESASTDVLRRIGKPLNLEQVEQAVALSRQSGIQVELFSQYGLPGERYEDALKTLAFVQRNGVAVRGNTNPQQMQIYFGTEIQRCPEDYGILPLEESRPAYLSLGPRYETRWMSAEEIRAIGRLWRQASLDGGKHIVS